MSEPSSASTLAVKLVEENIRKGEVVRVPSIGVILTSANLVDKTGAVSAKREDIIEALQDCLRAQEAKHSVSQNQEERTEIEEIIARLKAGINDQSDYLL